MAELTIALVNFTNVMANHIKAIYTSITQKLGWKVTVARWGRFFSTLLLLSLSAAQRHPETIPNHLCILALMPLSLVVGVAITRWGGLHEEPEYPFVLFVISALIFICFVVVLSGIYCYGVRGFIEGIGD